MIRYSITGRLFVGPLDSPKVNETDHQEYDDRDTAFYYCRSLVNLGYHVWLYEERRFSPMDPLRRKLIGEWEDGEAVP